MKHMSFEWYKKHIKPGISEINTEKQIAFARRVQSWCGLGKYLWIVFDEKWIYACVGRSKECKSMSRKVSGEIFSSVHHESHMEKVMCHVRCDGYSA